MTVSSAAKAKADFPFVISNFSFVISIRAQRPDFDGK
jgi:hypothetical protein